MENFKAIFNKINNHSGIIHIYHKLFGGKRYICENIHMIYDTHKIGVSLNGYDIYIPMNEVTELKYEENTFIVRSDRQLIKIFLKNP